MPKNQDDVTFAWSSSVRGDILSTFEELTRHFENKANWIISIASVILVFFLSNFEKFAISRISTLGVIIVLGGSAFSILNLTSMIIPNLFKSKRHKEELNKLDIFHYSNLRKNLTEEKLISYLKELRTNGLEMDKQFGRAIYQIADRRLPYLIKKLKMGGWTLVYSFLIGSALILIGMFI